MPTNAERYGWALAFAAIVALAVPWFLWGVDAVVVGLPVWIWWHIGWLVLAAATFYAFARRAWGLGVTEPVRGGEP